MSQEDDSQVRIAQIKKLALSLQSDNKRTRQVTFVELQTMLQNKFSQEDYHVIFNEIHIYALNGLRDPSEAVREKAINFWNDFLVTKLSLNDYYLSYLFPVLTERIGTCELIEESEEIRLKLVNLLKAVIETYSNTTFLKPFLNDIVLILCERIQDRFPDVKVISCRCVTQLAQALPRDFHLQAESLVAPVLTCFKHQRNLIRSEAIMCLGDIILESSYKGLEQAIGPLGERLLDNVPSVRRSIGLVAFRWLREHRDRYSHFPKMLPLILTLLNDETVSIRKEMQEKWELIGLQYMDENEKDLKDEIDFLVEPPKYYPNVERPNLGCRSLVARNIGKLCTAISNELLSWQDEVREKCSELLHILTLHAESSITQHMQSLLPAMYVAAHNEKRDSVLKKIIESGQLMGIFVATESWIKLVIPAVEDNPNCGNLIILRSLIQGSPKEYLFPYLNDITQILADENVCRIRKFETQEALYNCILSILSFHKYEYPSVVAQNIFIASVTLLSLRNSTLVVDNSMLDKLTENMNFNDANQLWCEYLTKLLDIIDRDPKSWVPVTAERCIFETILTNSGQAFGQNLEIIGSMLVESLNPEADCESRLKIFNALTTSFENKELFFKGAKDLYGFLKRVVSDVIAPSLIWRAGRSAEAIRTMAAVCLYSALKTSSDTNLFNSPDLLKSAYSKFLPLLISLCEDASYRSRQLAVQNIALFKELCSDMQIWEIEDLLKIYPEITKRLDDPIEKVREWSIRALSIILQDPLEEFKKVTYKSHHELLIDTLLTHLDDPDTKYHVQFTEMLKTFTQVCPELLNEKITTQKLLLRNQTDCEEILLHIKQLNL